MHDKTLIYRNVNTIGADQCVSTKETSIKCRNISYEFTHIAKSINNT